MRWLQTTLAAQPRPLPTPQGVNNPPSSEFNALKDGHERDTTCDKLTIPEFWGDKPPTRYRPLLGHSPSAGQPVSRSAGIDR